MPFVITLLFGSKPKSFALFPVVVRPSASGVLTYVIQRSGLALSRKSKENIVPGDYGIYEGKGVFVYKVGVVSSKRSQMTQGTVWILTSLASSLMRVGKNIMKNITSHS